MFQIKKKKKVLFVSEASFSNTGYGAYYHELLTRLHSLNKYHIAEFASFGNMNDPRDTSIKWRFYANEPNHSNQTEINLYNSNEANKTGSWRFEKVLLDFMPDIVIDLRDTTMFQYQALTSLRKFFYWIVSPSLDSEPQIDDWIGTILNADKVLTYTDYACEALKREGSGKIKLERSAWTGANFNVFKPLKNKHLIKQQLGISPNSLITMMNGRNQIRKLFIELLKAYRLYLDKIELIDKNIYNNSFLYLHTTQPDLKTWNLSKTIVEYGLENHCLFTYICTSCSKFFVNKYQDSITSCVYCGKQAILPRVNMGVTQENLNIIYNLADLYVQYASAGATEFPLVEAAAAGCNVMATDLAGTGDVCKRLGGTLLKTAATPRDINVDADRAAPDNEMLSEELVKFFRRPTQINTRNGIKFSEVARKKFSWDENAKIWEQVIDSVELTGYQGKWHSNIPFNPEVNIPDNIPIADWVYNIIDKALQEPGLKNTYYIDNLIKHSEVGIMSTGNGIISLGRKEMANILNSLLNNKITVEKIRKGEIPLDNEDWIQYAEIKELANI